MTQQRDRIQNEKKLDMPKVANHSKSSRRHLNIKTPLLHNSNKSMTFHFPNISKLNNKENFRNHLEPQAIIKPTL